MPSSAIDSFGRRVAFFLRVNDFLQMANRIERRYQVLAADGSVESGVSTVFRMSCPVESVTG